MNGHGWCDHAELVACRCSGLIVLSTTHMKYCVAEVHDDQGGMAVMQLIELALLARLPDLSIFSIKTFIMLSHKPTEKKLLPSQGTPIEEALFPREVLSLRHNELKDPQPDRHHLWAWLPPQALYHPQIL